MKKLLVLVLVLSPLMTGCQQTTCVGLGECALDVITRFGGAGLALLFVGALLYIVVGGGG